MAKAKTQTIKLQKITVTVKNPPSQQTLDILKAKADDYVTGTHEVWGITDGKKWFRTAYLKQETAQKVMESITGGGQQCIDVNIAIPQDYIIYIYAV